MSRKTQEIGKKVPPNTGGGLHSPNITVSPTLTEELLEAKTNTNLWPSRKGKQGLTLTLSLLRLEQLQAVKLTGNKREEAGPIGQAPFLD